jgi:hypothetical protein
MEVWMEEALFDRMVTHEGTPEDWDQLETVAERDGDVWRRLGLALRDHGDLVQVVDVAGDEADALDVGPLLPSRVRWQTRAGWLAAAAALMMWAGTSLVGVAPTETGTDPESTVPAAVTETPTAAEAQIVGELPSVLVGTRALPDDQGVEVTYLRRLIERRTTRGVYERGTDEWGQATAVPVSLPNPRLEEL